MDEVETSDTLQNGGKTDFSTGVISRAYNAGVGSPDQKLAAITRADWDKYENDFLPIEREVIQSVSDPSRATAKGLEAADLAGKTYDRATESFARGLSRSNTTLDADQISKISSNNDLDKTLAKVDASNKTRAKIEDQNIRVRQGLLEAGQELRGNAIQGLSAAAGMETSRQSVGQQLNANQKASQISTIGTMAGMGLAGGFSGLGAAAAAGPGGLAIGAGIGLLTSLF